MFLLSLILLTIILPLEEAAVTCPSHCLPNGIAIGGHEVGQTMIFHCDPGHIRVGPRQASCQIDGTWSDTVPQCKSVSMCPYIGGVDGGKIKRMGKRRHNLPGREVEFICNAGFDLSGSSKLKCNENGQWDHPYPKCINNKCSIISHLNNGHILSQDVSKNGKVHFMCDTGFELVGSSSLTCIDNKIWSGDIPTCRENICPRLYNFQYGTVTPAPGYYSNLSPGSTVSFTCAPGYTLTGASSLTCTDGLTWSASQPKCQYSRCKWVPFHKYGSIIRIGQDDVITKMLFSCKEGYKLTGVETLDCENKYWNSPIPKCSGHRCRNIKTFANGQVVNYSRTIGTQVTVQCDKGYKLGSVTHATCQDNKKWTTLPKCVVDKTDKSPAKNCKQIVDLHNGHCSGGRSPGSEVTCECDAGYQLVGAKILRCKNNLNYNSTLPKCVFSECPYLSAFYGGKVEGGNSAGEEVKFSCFDGFTLKGPSVLKCLDDGKWSDNPPTCKLTRCSNLLIVTHGSVQGNGDLEGETRTVTCDNGYKLIGEPVLTCVNKKWTPSLPKCVRRMCPPIHYIDNGVVEGQDYSVGAKMMVRCHNHYTLRGPAQIRCKHGFTWSKIPECSRIECPSIPFVNRGRFLNYNNLRGSVVTIKCDSGNTLAEKRKRLVCKPNGTWSYKTIPTCEGVTMCPSICLENGIVNYKKKFVGAKVNFSCLSGFTLHGASNATCEDNGTWSEDTPTCQ